MFRASSDATLTTTRHPGPVVARDGETTPNTKRQALMVLRMARSFFAFTVRRAPYDEYLCD
jgi:hypothetical protein